jgi:hypothetical protein
MKPPTIYPISEREREMWKKQNIADLLYYVDYSLTDKIKMVEGMVEVARSMHAGKLPPSPDEHQEPWGTVAS